LCFACSSPYDGVVVVVAVSVSVAVTTSRPDALWRCVHGLIRHGLAVRRPSAGRPSASRRIRTVRPAEAAATCCVADRRTSRCSCCSYVRRIRLLTRGSGPVRSPATPNGRQGPTSCKNNCTRQGCGTDPRGYSSELRGQPTGFHAVGRFRSI
jgi:hypothetical protein